MTRSFLVFVALSACTPKSTDAPADDTSTPGVDDDTGGGGDSGGNTDPGPCTTTVLGTEPAADSVDVYYRSPLVVSFDADGSAATFTLTDAGGGATPFTRTWTDGNVQAVLDVELAGHTVYTLAVDLCGVVTESSFTTSDLGSPLTIDPAELAGRTYSWRLSDAQITTPTFLNAIADAYLTTPILIAVTAADTATIDMIGGLGYLTDVGALEQQPTSTTWDFPAGDFTKSPYFEAYADLISISIRGTSIPVEGFHFSGTFSADGSTIAEGIGAGLGDTRNIGTILGSDDPNAVCDLAEASGLACEPCGSDGEPYCLPIVAEHITAEWEPTITLVVVP